MASAPTLYHDTSQSGLLGILRSNALGASTRAMNPNEAGYGDGQYLTNIVPGTIQPSRRSDRVNQEEPFDLYGVLDDQSWETRQVEACADGRLGYVDQNEGIGNTALSETPIQPLEEIARDPEYQRRETSREKLEAMRDDAHGRTPSLPTRS